MSEPAHIWASCGAKYPPPSKITPWVYTAELAKTRHEQYIRRRDARYARGLTARGKPRKRTYQHLVGWDDEQKRERRRAQQLEWRRAHPQYAGRVE